MPKCECLKMKGLGNQQPSSEQEKVQRLSRKGVGPQAVGGSKRNITYIYKQSVNRKGVWFMYDGEQIVRVRWNPSNAHWYTEKGYTFTKYGELFDVKAKDLMPKSDVKIKVVCDYCGKEYETQVALINNGRKYVPKDSCAKCNGEKGKEIVLRKNAHKYFSRLNDICSQYGYTLVSREEDYAGLREPVSYICPKHGQKTTTMDNLLHGHICSECSYETRFDTMRLTTEHVDSVVSSYGDTWLNPSEYKNYATMNLHIRCKCGNEFTTSFANFSRAGVTRCITCSSKESSGEVIIREFLEENKIEYVFNKRFQDCRDKKPLPFDFYLPDYNMCIEFDGQHHYQELPDWTDLEIVQRHDQIKDAYCQANGIRILRIPYYKGHYIISILKQELGI